MMLKTNETRDSIPAQGEGQSGVCIDVNSSIVLGGNAGMISTTGRKSFSAGHIIVSDGESFQFSKEELEEKNKEAIRLFDNWKASGTKEAYSAYLEHLIKKLHYMVAKHITAMHFDFGGTDPEDLFQSAALAICTIAKAYDPRRSMPSTFFGAKIDELLKKENGKTSTMSPHYREQKAKLDRAAQELGFDSCLSDGMPPEQLAMYTGISLQTVVNTIEQAMKTLSSMDDENFTAPPDFSKSPEKLFLDNESTEYLGKAYQSALSEYEQYIFRLVEWEGEDNGEGKMKKLSLRQMAARLAEPKYLKKFGLETAPDCTKIQRDIQIARMKLQHYCGMRARFSYNPVEENRFHPQAGDDELEAFVLQNRDSFEVRPV